MKYTEDTTDRSASLGVDTIFVLFFLAVEIGRSVQLFSVDGALMATTLATVLVLPYFLPSRGTRPSMSRWLAVRGSIAVAALFIGLAFSGGFGTVRATGTTTMPMTLLILSAMVSCYIQFYGLMRLRPAK